MNLHIFKMTENVDHLLALFQEHWAGDFGRDPDLVRDGDIVVLLGHGGGGSTVEFVLRWEGLRPRVPLKNTLFVLMMCGSGGLGGSAQMAELIVTDGARAAIYSTTTIIAAHVLEMPEALGVTHWADLFDKEDGELWDRPWGATGQWICLSNADGPTLGLDA